MSIESYIRSKTGELVRPFVIKDKCEFCGVSKNLHMHHVEPFAIMLKEAHKVLGIEYGEYDDYSEEERSILTNHMLGVQLQSNYLTLCASCHNDLHSEQDTLFEIGEAGLNPVELRRVKKEKQEEERVKRELLPYLIENQGEVMLNVKDRQEFIKMVNVRDGHDNRLVKGICAINKKLAEYKLPFKIISYATSRTVGAVRSQYSAAWQIVGNSNKGEYGNHVSNLGIEYNSVSVGEKYKYAELCKILKEEPKTGNSKPAQLNRWEEELDIKFVKEPRAYLRVVCGKGEDKSDIQHYG